MEKKKKKKVIMISALLLIILLLIGVFILCKRQVSKTDLSISGIQVSLGEETGAHKEPNRTRILGDDNYLISSEKPFIYLRNDSSNSVYLQFDVLNGDTVVYSSDLIEPGMMEAIDIKALLGSGKYELTYLISSYSTDTMEILLSGIKQSKELLII